MSALLMLVLAMVVMSERASGDNGWSWKRQQKTTTKEGMLMEATVCFACVLRVYVRALHVYLCVCVCLFV